MPLSAEDLYQRLLTADTASLLVMFDYDGTLVPIAPTPAQARPSDRLMQRLTRLADSDIMAAVVSGRALADLRALLPVPGLWLAGEHGGVVRKPGGEERWAVSPEAATPALSQLQALTVPIIAQAPGFFLERKRLSLALHYRLAAPHLARNVVRAVQQFWAAHARRHALALLTGKCVLEVRCQGVDKGAACRLLMREAPGAVALYVGDDTTDEDAFQVVAAAGGLTVVVGRSRPTSARYALAGPAEVESLLALLAMRAPAATSGDP